MIQPVEDIDFFRIKRVRYELYVEGSYAVIADEECDDFEIDPNKIELGEPMVVGKTVVGSFMRRIDDPTKAFDHTAWMVEHNPEMHAGEQERPNNETKLEEFR